MKINSNNEHEIKDNIMFMIEHTSMKSTEATNLKHFIPFYDRLGTSWSSSARIRRCSSGTCRMRWRIHKFGQHQVVTRLHINCVFPGRTGRTRLVVRLAQRDPSRRALARPQQDTSLMSMVHRVKGWRARVRHLPPKPHLLKQPVLAL